KVRSGKLDFACQKNHRPPNWLFYRFRGPNGVFPALPGDFPFGMASVGGPEHTRVQKGRGDVIIDKREGVMVTREVEAVDGLASGQEQNPKEEQKRKLQTEDD